MNGAIHAIDRIVDPRHSCRRCDPVKPPLEGPHTQFRDIINSPNHGSFLSRSWRRTARSNTNSAGDRGCAGGPQHHTADERQEMLENMRKYERSLPRRRPNGYNPDHHSDYFDAKGNIPLYDKSWFDWVSWLPQWGEND